MSECKCEERSEPAIPTAAGIPHDYSTLANCGVCKFTTTSGGRRQVAFCSAGCACHDNGSSEANCYRVSSPEPVFVQCCIDFAKENLRLSQQARLFAWLGAVVAIGTPLRWPAVANCRAPRGSEATCLTFGRDLIGRRDLLRFVIIVVQDHEVLKLVHSHDHAAHLCRRIPRLQFNPGGGICR